MRATRRGPPRPPATPAAPSCDGGLPLAPAGMAWPRGGETATLLTIRTLWAHATWPGWATVLLPPCRRAHPPQQSGRGETLVSASVLAAPNLL